MDYLLICTAALLASALTFFSGFGLGTLVLPAFALFFPVEAAVALTAIVHFLNNLFKLGLIGKSARWQVVLRFGVPALAASLLGAACLVWLSDLKPLMTYTVMGRKMEVMPVKLCISILMIFFALFELLTNFEKFSFGKRFLPLGGVLSGFFGGLSGHQGAFRSVFLIRTGLTKEQFIATGVVIACLVDLSRLFVYSAHLDRSDMVQNKYLLAAATLSAFFGAWLGNRFLKKMTLQSIQLIVSVLLLVISLALGAGIL